MRARHGGWQVLIVGLLHPWCASLAETQCWGVRFAASCYCSSAAVWAIPAWATSPVEQAGWFLPG